ncbi:type II toxin-antitoxin system VapC family toxin [Marinospirillum alkaliphilum]|uniref:PIN domain nuclease, a component of toxin-antitoxin system (PIN domain) n=1 Tax=Marinospirillum alkaliphilum DSM 21637 TaxID=1122209 RepID=A0A1K1V9K2_9GAMM|nr:type II toxin-antitoxin system VapC family toxin [Marinospirillum alkaliphilum]SFX21245.1 PIN domain nuclease, a component of toxin-antitoxin system (PIN domain) [Marinospirillum alkaliphilum DSM 21637]
MLLDTHIWIRWLTASNGEQALPGHLVEKIELSPTLAISAISCWELGQLVKRNRLRLQMPMEQWLNLACEGIQVIPVDRGIAELAAHLPEHHRDPADRFIIATSLIHNLPLISLDQAFKQYQELAEHLVG